MARPGLGLRGAAICAAIGLLLVGWIAARRLAAPGTAEPGTALPASAGNASLLDAVPAGAIAVVEVDVEALRHTRVGQRFLGKGRRIAGLGEVDRLCGSDPLLGVKRLAVAMPPGDDAGFGLVASGDLQAAGLLDCASQIVRRRGGKPVRQERGTFRVMLDSSLAAGSAQLAVRDGGPLLLAEPKYLMASLQVAEGHAPSAAADARHRDLRGLVAAGAVRATVVLSPQLRATLVDELRAQGMPKSPFSELSAAALSIGLRERIDAHALLQFESASAAAASAKVIDAARREEAASASAKLVGLSGMLQALEVSANGTVVNLRGRVSFEQAQRLLDNLNLLRNLPATPRPALTPPGPSGALRVELAPSATPAPSASTPNPD